MFFNGGEFKHNFENYYFTFQRAFGSKVANLGKITCFLMAENLNITSKIIISRFNVLLVTLKNIYGKLVQFV